MRIMAENSLNLLNTRLYTHYILASTSETTLYTSRSWWIHENSSQWRWWMPHCCADATHTFQKRFGVQARTKHWESIGSGGRKIFFKVQETGWKGRRLKMFKLSRTFYYHRDHARILPKDCFPLSGIFRAERNFLCLFRISSASKQRQSVAWTMFGNRRKKLQKLGQIWVGWRSTFRYS